VSDWANHQDIWVLQTRAGRFVIRRDGQGSTDFRLWLNKKPTTYCGTVEEMKAVVERILAVHLPKNGNEGEKSD